MDHSTVIWMGSEEGGDELMTLGRNDGIALEMCFCGGVSFIGKFGGNGESCYTKSIF